MKQETEQAQRSSQDGYAGQSPLETSEPTQRRQQHQVDVTYTRGKTTRHKEFSCPHGVNLLAAALKNKARLDHICQVGICGTCQVILDSDDGLSPPSAAERELLQDVLDDGVRLSCQARVTGDVTIHQ